jgi:hypothetical protein
MKSARKRAGLRVAGVVFVGVLAATLLPAVTGSRAADQPPVIKVLGNRADLLSDGDSLVQVVLPPRVAVSKVKVDVGGRDVTSSFAVRADGRYLGYVTGLADGPNVLTVRSPGGGAQLTLTNHAIGGPIFSGAQIQPWLCTTDSNGLGPAQDSQCDAPTTYSYQYKSTDSTKSGFQPYDPNSPPTDVAMTTTDQGQVVPYVVRLERGTADRGIYDIAVLTDPTKPWEPWASQKGWNHKLYYVFGPSCGTIHSQSSPNSVLVDMALSRGFMVATSSMNVLGNNCNTVTSAEAAMMLKERIAERYGSIRYTIGTGCSGGSIGQHTVANAYPGLVDGLQPACTFEDNWTTGTEVMDCHLLVNYFKNNPSEPWVPMIDGHHDPSDCAAWDVTFSAVQDPKNGCSAGTRTDYNPDTNPTGCRGDLQDFQLPIWGKRPQSMWTSPAEKTAGGFARWVFDNVGVQYGLTALNSGLITPAEFADLNSKVGGMDIDFNFVPNRREADPGTVLIAHRTGAVNDGRQLAGVPIISLQDWSETAEIHTSYHSWAMRARLDKANGNHDNQIIWTYPAQGPILGVGPDSAVALKSFLLIDRWLGAMEADTAPGTLAQKAARDKPADAVDACFVADNEITDMGTCRQLYPYYGDARISAGGSLAGDVMKCQLKPLNRGDYNATFTDAEWAQLQQAFPTGVCDWSKPGVDQVPSTPWITFAGGPGGQPLGPAPVSQALR